MANASDKAALIEAAAWLPCRQPILEVEVSVAGAHAALQRHRQFSDHQALRATDDPRRERIPSLSSVADVLALSASVQLIAKESRPHEFQLYS